MTIIPSENKNAANGVFMVLKDLLFWADGPHQEDLPNGWAALYRETVARVLAVYERSFADDAAAMAVAKRCKRVCWDFIGLMDNVPGLSKLARLEWTVRSHQRVFDELAELRDHFEKGFSEDTIGQPVNQTASIPEAAAAALVVTPAIMPRRSKRDKTQKRWTVQDVEERIRLELKSSDAATHEKYLFATADELELLIGCERKTAMKTLFWKEDRDPLQKAWRRKNTKGDRPLKQDL